MKKNSIPVSEIPELTIGLDLSDRSFQFCELNAKGEIVKEGQLKLNRTSLRKYLAAQPKARVALETGGQSAWVKPIIEELGHQAVVANARELEAGTRRSHRSDHHDGRPPARFARAVCEFVHPGRLADGRQQADILPIR